MFAFQIFDHVSPFNLVNVDKETFRYIIIHFPNLLSEVEIIALRHARSLEKLGDKDKENSAHAEFFRKRGLLTTDPEALDLLKDGYDTFERNACERILKECPEKVFFNYCPQCSQLARTPYARQCRFCLHSWHDIITTKFRLQFSYAITNRGFFIFGEVIDDGLQAGQFLDLTMLGLARKPKINSIEYAVKNIDGQPTGLIGLGTDDLNEGEMDYLKKVGSFGTPLDILKER